MDNIKEIILGTLFVSGEGVEIADIAEKLELSEKEIRGAIDSLKTEYSGKKGIRLIEYRKKIQLCSNPDYAEQISSVLNPIRERALTKAALQTLAIIAYKQPITKLEIEEIRQAGCDYTVQLLLEQKMIEVVGRKDAVGKPLLLGTTEEFLKRFDLPDLTALPDYESLIERIKVINTDNLASQGSLYRDFKLPDEEAVPEFLQGEKVEKIEGETA